MLTRLLLPSLLALPALALAQGAGQTSLRPYLGVSASLYNESLFHSDRTYASPTAVGASLTGGVQFGPRLAVQLSPALHWGGEHVSTSIFAPVVGQPASTTRHRDTHTTQLVVPLLLRYTFTAPTARLHVEALAGGAWLRATSQSTYTITDPTTGAVLGTLPPASATDSYAALTLGPALRYGLGPRLELAAALPVHYALRTVRTYLNEPAGFGDYLAWQATLGVQYALGSR